MFFDVSQQPAAMALDFRMFKQAPGGLVYYALENFNVCLVKEVLICFRSCTFMLL